MKYFLIIFISLLITSCNSYNDVDYIKAENEVIKDLIFVLSDAERMLKYNDNKNFTILYTLDFIGLNSFDGVFDNLSDSLKRLVKPIINGRIKDRKLNLKLDSGILEIKELSKSDFNDLRGNNIAEYFDDSDSALGIITFSRVQLNGSLDSGFLYYTFFCGSACAWGGFIEIRKVNDKWKKVSEFGSFIS